MPTNPSKAETLLCNVVHDLRQPLGTIEISAYLLNQALREAPEQVREHICAIERQVDVAARALDEAVAELGRLRVQRAEAFNLPQPAAVT